MSDRRYFPGVDVLRVIAMFGIVGCHLALPNMTDGALLVKKYTDLNVAVFSALAGFFFFGGSRESFGGYLRKRCLRLLVPYLLWTLVYIVFSSGFHTFSTGTPDFSFLKGRRLMAILIHGDASAHLWFVVSLFYAQVMLFPVRAVRLGWLMLAGSLMIESLIVGHFCWWVFYPLRMFGFFLIGSWLRTIADMRRMSWMHVVMLAAMFSLGVYALSCWSGWLALNEALVAAPVCVVAVRFRREFSAKTSLFLRKLGEMTFIVYFVHLLFTITFREIIVRICPVQNVFVYILDQSLAFVLSMAFAFVLMNLGRRYPFVRAFYGNWNVTQDRVLAGGGTLQ